MMKPIELKQIEGSYFDNFDFVIDASEGRLTADLYTFQVSHQGKLASILIKVIGIGVDPKAWLANNVIVVQANSGIWMLHAGSTDFKEVDIGYPLYDLALTPSGLLVFHLLGCELRSLVTGAVIWRYLGGQLSSFAVVEDAVSLTFDEEEIRLRVDTGMVL